MPSSACRADPRLQEIGHLGENRDGQHDVRGRARPPRVHTLVPGVARVDQRVDRTGIGDDGQPCGSRHRSSSTRVDVSVDPLEKRPAIDGSPRRRLDVGDVLRQRFANDRREAHARARASFCIRLIV